MKQFLLTLLFSFSIFTGIVTLIAQYQPVYAQDTIELNFGEVAKDNDVIGTQNYEPDDGEAGFGVLIERILTIAITVAALIVFMMLLWGGFEWITAGGDKGKIEKARNRIAQSIIGLIVLASTVAIFAMLQTALNFEIFNIGSGSSTGGSPIPPSRLPDCGPGVPSPCNPVPM